VLHNPYTPKSLTLWRPHVKAQWAEAHAASKGRADHHTECSICRDEFKVGHISLSLSLSHALALGIKMGHLLGCTAIRACRFGLV
jgi:hypothetical protein